MAETSISALISHALVAFTIEFDNELEHRMPHRTAADRGSKTAVGPWLVSQAMWVNALQYIPESGIARSALIAMARTEKFNLNGLIRWRYVTASDGADPLVRLTPSGIRAGQVLSPLAAEIEGRWSERYGDEVVGSVRSALAAIVDGTGLALPRYLPITSPTMNGRGAVPNPATAQDRDRDLSVLLAQALQAFQLEFETESRISLPISANLLRVLGSDPMPLRALPGLSGVARPGIDPAVGFLKRIECVAIETAAGARGGKALRLTSKGQQAKAKYVAALTSAEERWSAQHSGSVKALRQTLAGMTIESPTPYPDGWRANAKALPLPDFPMVLHRGGYPDGS